MNFRQARQTIIEQGLPATVCVPSFASHLLRLAPALSQHVKDPLALLRHMNA